MLRWNASNGFRDKCFRVKHCDFQITIMPIGSMGLVYLPTFTMLFMPFMQVNIQSVPWIRHGMLISSFDLLQMVENNFNNFPIIWCPLVSNTSLGVNWKQVYPTFRYSLQIQSQKPVLKEMSSWGPTNFWIQKHNLFCLFLRECTLSPNKYGSGKMAGNLKGAVTTIGDTPIFNFHDSGRKGKHNLKAGRLLVGEVRSVLVKFQSRKLVVFGQG